MANIKPHALAQLARQWCGKSVEELTDAEVRVLGKVVARRSHLRDPNEAFDDRSTLGERLADRVALFGGSWGFIIAFGVVLIAWTALNLFLAKRAFDAYPFIFLNLLLSMLAAIQAPVILMSQNRQSAKDRSDAAHDYQVNLKAEIEIVALHDKLDQLRTDQIETMLKRQREQVDLLSRLLGNLPERSA